MQEEGDCPSQAGPGKWAGGQANGRVTGIPSSEECPSDPGHRSEALTHHPDRAQSLQGKLETP